MRLMSKQSKLSKDILKLLPMSILDGVKSAGEAIGLKGGVEDEDEEILEFAKEKDLFVSGRVSVCVHARAHARVCVCVCVL